MTDYQSLIAWAKANAKPDANVAEFEELAKQFAIPESQPETINWMNKIPALRSALDAEKNREYDKGYKAYEEKKLPETEKALRDSIFKELHPEETPEQKELRAIREELAQAKKEKEMTSRKSALMEKAKELGLDPMIAADYAVYGDEAHKVLKRHADYLKSQIDAVKNDAAKSLYGGKTPPAGSGAKKAVKDMTPDEAMQYAAQGEAQRAEVLAAFKK